MDNSEVAKGLQHCGFICDTTFDSLRQALTIYQMSCLIIRIILCMGKDDFEKLCSYFENQEHVGQHLSELYFGKCAGVLTYVHV